nr:ORF3 [Torque teno felis virus]QYD01890.1 ORF3 [Torque teno felis virus]
MNADRSPSKQHLRGMLVRRSLEKKTPRPKRLKRSRTANLKSALLLKALQDNFSESSLSAGECTGSSSPF